MELHESQGGTILTIVGAAGSIASFVHAHLTQNNISWFVGICVGIGTIVNIYMAVRTHWLRQRVLRRKLNDEEEEE